MKLYKVTMHEHRIFDAYVSAVSLEEAEEIAENQVIEEDRAKWTEDFNAGWTEVGEIEEVDDEEDVDAELV